MKKIFFLLSLISLMACSTSKKVMTDDNPAAVGFKAEDSDSQAIAIADEVMKAMGGRRAWDNTQNITWNFFGFRKITWDKKGDNVKVDNIKANNVVIYNMKTMKGMAKKGNEIVKDTAELAILIDKAHKIWINDSYWLLMPFKLKDSGVTLHYIGEETLNDKKMQVLQLNFDNVGVTPENKYRIFVNKDTHLVEKWAFFRKSKDVKPEFENDWSDYQKYGNILLSGNRGRKEGSLSEISVDRKLGKNYFKSF